MSTLFDWTLSPTFRPCLHRWSGPRTADGMSCPPRSWREHLTISPRVFLQAADRMVERGERTRMLFVGDDWAEDHHDVEIQDENGKKLAKARLPEGIPGIARFHDLIGR